MPARRSPPGSTITPPGVRTRRSEMRRLPELEDENSRLKKIVADLTLDREMLQDVIKRKH